MPETMKIFPVVETRRLLLEEFQTSDAKAVFEIFSQEFVTRYHNLETMKSIEQALDLIKIRAGIFKQGVGIRWAIAIKGDPGRVIGSCGYYNLDQENHSAEIGYDLHSAFWKQGIMTEALRTMINLGYSGVFTFSLNRIQALTYLDHETSGLLLRKLGFQEEGILREWGYWKHAYHDLRVYSLLRTKWEERDLAF